MRSARRRARVDVGGRVEVARPRRRPRRPAARPRRSASSAGAARTGVEPDAEQRDPGAALRDRARHAGQREVAVAPRDLLDREATPRRATPESAPRPAARRVRPRSSTFRRRSRRPRPAGVRHRGPASSSSAPSATATAGYSDAGSACASEPPTVPRLRIWKCPISGVACASSGTAARDLRIALHHALAGRRPAPRACRSPARSPASSADAVHVDEVLEVREAQRQHRHEALPAGQHLGVVAVLGEQRADLVDRLRRVVLERRRLHAAKRYCRADTCVRFAAGAASRTSIDRRAARVADRTARRSPRSPGPTASRSIATLSTPGIAIVR